MLWYCVNKYQIYIPLHLWQYLSWNYTEELCWCHIPLLGTAVTVPPGRQLPFQNGSYRSRTAYAMALPFQNGSYRFRTVVTVSERQLPFQNGICHGMSVVATAVTVSERQLPFQNGTYRSRTAYAMVCQWSRWHMPQANKRSRPYWRRGSLLLRALWNGSLIERRFNVLSSQMIWF